MNRFFFSPGQKKAAMKIYIFVPKNLSNPNKTGFEFWLLKFLASPWLWTRCVSVDVLNDLNREQIVIYLHLIAFGFCTIISYRPRTAMI